MLFTKSPQKFTYVSIDGNDLPISLPFINHAQDSQNFDRSHLEQIKISSWVNGILENFLAGHECRYKPGKSESASNRFHKRPKDRCHHPHPPAITMISQRLRTEQMRKYVENMPYVGVNVIRVLPRAREAAIVKVNVTLLEGSKLRW